MTEQFEAATPPGMRRIKLRVLKGTLAMLAGQLGDLSADDLANIDVPPVAAVAHWRATVDAWLATEEDMEPNSVPMRST